MPNRPTWKNKFRYYIDNFISKGTPAMILALALVFFGTAVLSGIIVYMMQVSEGDNSQPMSLPESVWQALMHVLDQGTVTGEYGWGYRIIMLPVSLIGILILTTLISILNTGFSVKVEELNKGKTFVFEENHTVILGWSSKIFTIIKEIAIANENQKSGCIVILADMDKLEMEDDIRTKVGKLKNTKIICRHGNPKDMDDTVITNIDAAKSIIILAPEESKADTYVIKTLMAIVNNPVRKKEPYNIIAELNYDINREIAQLVGKDEVTILTGNEVISKITVQASRQNGLSLVYGSLLGFQDDEIYILPVENIGGHTFEELLYGFEEVSVIGIKYAEGDILLNPPLETVLRKDDQLIVIAEDDIELKYQPQSKQIKKVIPQNIDKEAGIELHKTLILGWNDNTRIIITELDNYVKKGSEVFVIAEGVKKMDDKINEIASKLTNQSISYIQGDINDRNLLNELDFKQYDHVIIVSYSETYPVQEADAISLITLMHIRDILNKIDHKLSLVTEMLDIKNRALADLSKSDDFIISDQIISLLLAQLSEDKNLSVVFDDLFDADGVEIYLKPITNYLTVGNEKNDFYSVIQSAKAQDEIAFGYIKSEYVDSIEMNYGVVINPKKSDLVHFNENDRLIVISEN